MGFLFFVIIVFIIIKIALGGCSNSYSNNKARRPARHLDYMEFNELLDDFCSMHDIDRDDINEYELYQMARLYEIAPEDPDDIDMMMIDADFLDTDFIDTDFIDDDFPVMF